jgi:hypothetical protein
MRAGVLWSHAGVSRRALLVAQKGKWQSPIQRPVELPRLARPKGCFAAHGGGSIDELSGRTTGRLGYIRPTTAHAIGGTAELALRYSYHLRIFRRAEPLQGATTGRTVLQEYGATPSYPPGPQDLSGTTGRAGAADAAADAAEAAVPFRDYGPDGVADGLSRSTPRQADDTTTRPSGERADASVRCTGLGVSNTFDEARAG